MLSKDADYVFLFRACLDANCGSCTGCHPSLMLSYVCIYNASELHVHPFHRSIVFRHMWHAQEVPHKSIGCHHDLQTCNAFARNLPETHLHTARSSIHHRLQHALTGKNKEFDVYTSGGGGGKQGITKHAPCTDGGQTLQFISAQVIFDRQAYPCHLVMCNVLTKQCLGMSNDICFPVLVTCMSRQSL